MLRSLLRIITEPELIGKKKQQKLKSPLLLSLLFTQFSVI